MGSETENGNPQRNRELLRELVEIRPDRPPSAEGFPEGEGV